MEKGTDTRFLSNSKGLMERWWVNGQETHNWKSDCPILVD